MEPKLDKVDILLEEEVSSEDLTPEEQMQADLETAERYINIAQHMNQFEDQDTYYTRAIQYARKVRNYYRHIAKDEYMDEVCNLISKYFKGKAKKDFRSLSML